MNLYATTYLTATFLIIVLSDAAQASTVEIGRKLRLVALTGPSPIGLPDARAVRLYLPKLNAAGLVAFTADNFGASAPDDYAALFAEAEEGSLRTVAENGKDASGLGGTQYAYFPYQPIAYTDSNQLVFEATLEDFVTDPIYHGGLWLSQDGSEGPLAHWNSRRNLLKSPTNFHSVYDIKANASGHIIIRASKDSGANFNLGLLRMSPGSEPERIIGVGDATPGIANSTFRNLRDFEVNKSGKVAFHAWLNSGGGNGFDSIYAEGDNGLFPVVTEGMQIPGASQQVRFLDISNTLLNWNNLGELSFTATTSSTEASGPFRSGIWGYSEATGLSSLVRVGDPAPDTTGATFREVYTNYLDDEGRVLFGAVIEGPGITGENKRGLWQLQKDGQTIVKIAQSGDLAPGGGRFDPYLSNGTANEAGQVVFQAFLENLESGQLPSPFGVWATDRRGNLQLIMKPGMLVHLGDFIDDPLREVSEVTAGNFNARGELALSIAFTDGTQGIFVSRQVAIPEPSALVLMFLATITIFLSSSSLRRVPPACQQ